MSGYLTHWRDDPNPVLRELADAGDCYHSTEGWHDDDVIKPSCCDRIEAAAREQDNEITRLRRKVALGDKVIWTGKTVLDQLPDMLPPCFDGREIEQFRDALRAYEEQSDAD